jgi:DNA-binding transcriptional LysR family regulator
VNRLCTMTPLRSRASDLSFTRAAIRLGISQSALSRAIHRLIETLRQALDDVSERLAAVTSMRS